MQNGLRTVDIPHSQIFQNISKDFQESVHIYVYTHIINKCII